MKFNLIAITLLVILNISLILAGSGTYGHNFDVDVALAIASGDSSGVKIFANQNFTIQNVTVFNGVSGNRVSLYNGSSGALLNSSNLSNNVAQVSFPFIAGNFYRIEVNITNGSDWTHICKDLTGILPKNLSLINWVNGSFNQADNNGFYCNIERITYSNNLLSSNSSTYTTSTLETRNETFNSNFTIDGSVSSARLVYNNENYGTTVSQLGTNFYNFLRTIDVPTFSSNFDPNWFWNITLSNGTSFPSTTLTQTSDYINLTICGASPQNVPYVAFIFKNETTSQQRVNASITSSTWNYYLGQGTVNKTLSYSNSAENKEYDFCFSPNSTSVFVDLTLSYDNAESEQRTYDPDIVTYTSTITNNTLYLLPTSEGLYVTFQIINQAEQPIDGALVILSRSGFGTISETTTGSSGTTNVFLNPNFEYTLTVSKDGYETFTTTQTFPTSEFTVTLGGTSTTFPDLTRGISINILPKVQVLENNTYYNFNMTINSTFWDLERWGYSIRNSSGTQLVYNYSTLSTGGLLSSNISTGNHTLLTMEYFWRANGTDTNYTVSWSVRTVDSGSIAGFFTRLRTYMNQGIFGIDSFGVALLLFVFIFIVTGLLSYSFGLRSPLAIFGVSGALIILMETLGFFESFNIPRGVLSTLIVLIFIGIYFGGRN